MNENIQTRIEKIFKEGNLKDEELKAIEPILRENANECVGQFFKLYFLTFILLISWFLVKNSFITEIKLFDLDIKNREIVLISLPFLATIIYYRANSFFIMYQLIDSLLKRIYVDLFPNFGSSTVVYFLEYPSFATLENIQSDFKGKSIFNHLGLLLTVLVLNLLPIIFLVTTSMYLIIAYWHNWTIIVPLINILILLKIILDIVFASRQL